WPENKSNRPRLHAIVVRLVLRIREQLADRAPAERVFLSPARGIFGVRVSYRLGLPADRCTTHRFPVLLSPYRCDALSPTRRSDLRHHTSSRTRPSLGAAPAIRIRRGVS